MPFHKGKGRKWSKKPGAAPVGATGGANALSAQKKSGTKKPKSKTT